MSQVVHGAPLAAQAGGSWWTCASGTKSRAALTHRRSGIPSSIASASPGGKESANASRKFVTEFIEVGGHVVIVGSGLLRGGGGLAAHELQSVQGGGEAGEGAGDALALEQAERPALELGARGLERGELGLDRGMQRFDAVEQRRAAALLPSPRFLLPSPRCGASERRGGLGVGVIFLASSTPPRRRLRELRRATLPAAARGRVAAASAAARAASFCPAVRSRGGAR